MLWFGYTDFVMACTAISKTLILDYLICVTVTVAHAQNLAVASLAQQQVTAPLLTQPGVATPTIYSLGGSQPQLAPQQQFQPQLVQVKLPFTTDMWL